jgi:hypothetical protein
MANPRELTKADIIEAARNFRWARKMTRWTVIVGERELPARPLVLEAAGVPPNDTTNSHQAVAILEELGFQTRYARERSRANEETKGAEGSPAGGVASIADELSVIADGIPNGEWDRLPRDLSKNLDHYLYGARKIEE